MGMGDCIAQIETHNEEEKQKDKINRHTEVYSQAYAKAH